MARRARWRFLAISLGVIAVCAGLWRFTPLAEWVKPQHLLSWLTTFRSQPWAPFAIVGLFIVGGLIAFPVVALIGVTALVLSPLLAFTVSLIGSLASALATYAIGARFVRGAARNAFGSAVQKVRSALSGQGVIAVALIRTVPVAPFTVVNIAAGCIGIPLKDYLLGTALGLAPGLVVITAFGQQLRTTLDHPTVPRIAALLAIITGWIGLSLLLQRVVARKHRPQADELDN